MIAEAVLDAATVTNILPFDDLVKTYPEIVQSRIMGNKHNTPQLSIVSDIENKMIPPNQYEEQDKTNPFSVTAFFDLLRNFPQPYFDGQDASEALNMLYSRKKLLPLLSCHVESLLLGEAGQWSIDTSCPLVEAMVKNGDLTIPSHMKGKVIDITWPACCNNEECVGMQLKIPGVLTKEKRKLTALLYPDEIGSLLSGKQPGRHYAIVSRPCILCCRYKTMKIILTFRVARTQYPSDGNHQDSDLTNRDANNAEHVKYYENTRIPDNILLQYYRNQVDVVGGYPSLYSLIPHTTEHEGLIEPIAMFNCYMLHSSFDKTQLRAQNPSHRRIMVNQQAMVFNDHNPAKLDAKEATIVDSESVMIPAVRAGELLLHFLMRVRNLEEQLPLWHRILLTNIERCIHPTVFLARDLQLPEKIASFHRDRLQDRYMLLKLSAFCRLGASSEISPLLSPFNPTDQWSLFYLQHLVPMYNDKENEADIRVMRPVRAIDSFTSFNPVVYIIQCSLFSNMRPNRNEMTLLFGKCAPHPCGTRMGKRAKKKNKKNKKKKKKKRTHPNTDIVDYDDDDDEKEEADGEEEEEEDEKEEDEEEAGEEQEQESEEKGEATGVRKKRKRKMRHDNILRAHMQRDSVVGCFVMDWMLCSITGNYPHVTHDNRLELGQRATWMLLRSLDNKLLWSMVDTPHWGYYCLREQLVYCVDSHPAMYENLCTRYPWDEFKQHVIETNNHVRGLIKKFMNQDPHLLTDVKAREAITSYCSNPSWYFDGWCEWFKPLLREIGDYCTKRHGCMKTQKRVRLDITTVLTRFDLTTGRELRDKRTAKHDPRDSFANLSEEDKNEINELDMKKAWVDQRKYDWGIDPSEMVSSREAEERKSLAAVRVQQYDQKQRHQNQQHLLRLQHEQRMIESNRASESQEVQEVCSMFEEIPYTWESGLLSFSRSLIPDRYLTRPGMIYSRDVQEADMDELTANQQRALYMCASKLSMMREGYYLIEQDGKTVYTDVWSLMLTLLPCFGCPPAAIEGLISLKSEYEENRCGKGLFRDIFQQFEQVFPFTTRITRLMISLWRQMSNFGAWDLPMHYVVNQMKAVTHDYMEKFPVNKDQQTVVPLMEDRVYLVYCVCCLTVYTDVIYSSSPNNNNNANRRHRRHVVNSDNNNNNNNNNKHTHKQRDFQYGMKNVLVNFKTGGLYCSRSEKRFHLRCRDQPLKQLFAIGKIIKFKRALILICPQPQCGRFFEFTNDHCTFNGYGVACPYCTLNIMQQRQQTFYENHKGVLYDYLLSTQVHQWLPPLFKPSRSQRQSAASSSSSLSKQGNQPTVGKNNKKQKTVVTLESWTKKRGENAVFKCFVCEDVLSHENAVYLFPHDIVTCRKHSLPQAIENCEKNPHATKELVKRFILQARTNRNIDIKNRDKRKNKRMLQQAKATTRRHRT